MMANIGPSLIQLLVATMGQCWFTRQHYLIGPTDACYLKKRCQVQYDFVMFMTCAYVSQMLTDMLIVQCLPGIQDSILEDLIGPTSIKLAMWYKVKY